MTDTAAMPPAILAAIDQASAEARSLRAAVVAMWTEYTEAGLPEDMIRSLIAQYHRVALGAPADPVTGPVFVGGGGDGLEECAVCGEEM